MAEPKIRKRRSFRKTGYKKYDKKDYIEVYKRTKRNIRTGLWTIRKRKFISK